MNECIWKQHHDGYYDTECGNAFGIEVGNPFDNKMKYCPFCGKEIKEVTHEP